MSAPEHALALLGLARRDLAALQAMVNQGVFVDEIFGFHAQQAIEKAFKAWLAGMGVDFPKTHDLSVLVGLLEGAGADAAPFRELAWLTAFAVQLRYSIYDDLGEPLDRPSLHRSAAALIEHVHSALAG